METTEPILTAMGGPRTDLDRRPYALHLDGRSGRPSDLLIEVADAEGVAAHDGLRHDAFVRDQRLFEGTDRDDLDGEPTTVVLVARRTSDRAVIGGVRIHPHEDHDDLGWWRGSRLVVAPHCGLRTSAKLVQAATAHAESRGAIRFDATVQVDKEKLFRRLGWKLLDHVEVLGVPHALMLAPVDRFRAAIREHKAPLGRLLAGMAPGGPGHVGDDGAPVPGSDLVAACDAILPAMVERDPEWAGWASVLVNMNDLAAMGATPVGILDAVAGPTEADIAAVLRGLRAAAEAYGVAILGGHTQIGDRAALSVTALGRAEQPVPGGGGRSGDAIGLIADLGGDWRPGFTGRQWDSTTRRSPAELQAMIGTLGRWQPRAAKDVSMAGLVGSLAMLAEAGRTGAEIDIASVPRPANAALADWLTCFPGFALLTAQPAAEPMPQVAPATSAIIGRLTDAPGEIRLRWPDGRTTPALAGPVTGLGPAGLTRWEAA